MPTLESRLPSLPLPPLPTYEEPSVARFLVVPGSDAGFTVPATPGGVSDLHLRNIDAPGVTRNLPALLLFRTRYRDNSRFSDGSTVPPSSSSRATRRVPRPGTR